MRLRSGLRIIFLFCTVVFIILIYLYYKINNNYFERVKYPEVINNIKRELIQNKKGIDEFINIYRSKLSPKTVYTLKSSKINDFAKIEAKLKTEEEALQIDMLDYYRNLPFANIDGGLWKQGFNITYKESDWNSKNVLKIFVVPHSHNDPGWLKTFQEYYDSQTKYIFENLIVFMDHEPLMKFIFAEVSYIYLWWKEASKTKRDIFKRLIARGQLEIVNSAWVMNDEANTHYHAMIDQTQQGQLWLHNNLGGIRANYGWFIDPFGHSPANAYLLKRFGFKGTLIQRVHYYVKKMFSQSQTLEFRWRQNWDVLGRREMFTHMMPFYSYDIPHSCGPDPSICCQFDFNRLPIAKSNMKCPWGKAPEIITRHNIQKRAELLLDQYRKKSKLYRTGNNVLIPLGDDFRYRTGEEWKYQIQNYLALFEWINAHQARYHVEIKFATLSEYFESVMNETELTSTANIAFAVDESVTATKDSSLIKDIPGLGGQDTKNKLKFPVVRGDFFTYADKDDNYWSGYFTSRPNYKRLDRVLQSKLRAAEIFYSLALTRFRQALLLHKNVPRESIKIWNEHYEALEEARNNMGLFQHHDGITGTARTHVMTDYANRMRDAIQVSEKILGHSLNFLLNHRDDLPNEKLQSDGQIDFIDYRSNASTSKFIVFRNEIADIKKFVVINSLTFDRDRDVINMYVNAIDVCLFDERDRPVVAQISPLLEDSSHIEENISGMTDVSRYFFQLSFKPTNSSGLTPVMYTLKRGHKHCTLLERYTLRSTVKYISRDGESEYYKKYSDQAERNGFHVELEDRQNDPLNFHLPCDDVMYQFNSLSGFLEKYVTSQRTIQANIGFSYYQARKAQETSGAYLFMPDRPARSITVDSSRKFNHVTTFLIKGPIFSKIVTKFPIRYGTESNNSTHYPDDVPYLTHMLTITNCQNPTASTESYEPMVRPRIFIVNHIDFTLPVNENKEVVMTIDTDLNDPEGAFYTDNNGLQIQKRVYLDKLPIQANFYPMPTIAFVQESYTSASANYENKIYRMTLLTAQPLGVGSLKPGSLEVVMDRKFSQDDNRGLVEIVRDNVPYTNRFELIFEKVPTPIESDNLPFIDSQSSSQSLTDKYRMSNMENPLFWLHTSDSWKNHLSLLHPPLTYVVSPNASSAFNFTTTKAFFNTLLPVTFNPSVHLVNFKTFKLKDELEMTTDQVEDIYTMDTSQNISCIFHSTVFYEDAVRDIFNIPSFREVDITNLTSIPTNLEVKTGLDSSNHDADKSFNRHTANFRLNATIDPFLLNMLEKDVTAEQSSVSNQGRLLKLRSFEIEAYKISIYGSKEI